METELTKVIESYQDEEDPEVQGGWQITNTTSADWAMKRASECEAEIASVKAQFAAAVERLEKRRDALIERAERGASYFRFKLEEWATQNRPALLKGKGKSVQLLHGKLGWRTSGGRLQVEDKDALAQWLAQQPIETGMYRVRVEPEMRALQEHCKRTGECPPGTTFVPETDTFYVKPDEAPETALEKP